MFLLNKLPIAVLHIIIIMVKRIFIRIYHSIYIFLFDWCTANSLRAHADPTVLYEALLCCYDDLVAIPLRSYRDGVPTAFVLSMHKVRAIARRSMRPHRGHWRCLRFHGAQVGVLVFLDRRGIMYNNIY